MREIFIKSNQVGKMANEIDLTVRRSARNSYRCANEVFAINACDEWVREKRELIRG